MCVCVGDEEMVLDGVMGVVLGAGEGFWREIFEIFDKYGKVLVGYLHRRYLAHLLPDSRFLNKNGG